MKQLKKIMLGCMLVLAMTFLTACGNRNTDDKNGTTDGTTNDGIIDDNEATNGDDKNGTRDDVTDTDKTDTKNDRNDKNYSHKY